jgi:biotin carboxylase
VEKRVRHEIYAITKRFGDYVYNSGIFKGMYGIDFVVDVDTHEVFTMEVNPRLTGSMTTTYQTYQAQGFRFPHLLFHVLAYMDVDAEFDTEAISKEWEGLEHY